VEHTGSYDHLGNAWSAAFQYAQGKKLKLSKAGAYEVYRNNPHVTPPDALRTDVFLLLKS
jgi:effector-binding domain-containing protein